MPTLSLCVDDISNGAGVIGDTYDLNIYAGHCDDDIEPCLMVSMGPIGAEILAFTIKGAQDIAMLGAFCNQVVELHAKGVWKL